MSHSNQEVHDHDRKVMARSLNLSLEKFDGLVSSANYAYEVIKDLGPFYGKEENKEPTFRIPAEPVLMPRNSEKKLTLLGNDLLHLAKALQKLPTNVKKKLADDLDFRIPPTWRIDVIIDSRGRSKVNEIEGQDGASALMIAEQVAYGIQNLNDSTAAKIATTLIKMSDSNKVDPYKIAHIRVDNQHNTNANRFINFIEKVSNSKLKIDHINENHIVEGSVKPKWEEYAGVIVETSYPPQKFYDMGLKREQVISAGVNNAFVNKGVFALFFDDELEKFWEEQLGKARNRRLRNILIPSYFINSVEELRQARKKGKVVKVSWAGEKAYLINRSKGVAIPDPSVEQGSDERWNELEKLLQQGIRIIAQDFVVPGKFASYLRKKAISLEYVDWYNRVCVKYVAEGNPNADKLPSVALTATEVTLGPEVVPAGRKCAFTAGIYR